MEKLTMTLTIELPDEQAERLKERARIQNQTLEALVGAMLSDLLTDHQKRVQESLTRILKEDHELLMRLA